MTREQAIAFHDSGAWKDMTDRERAALQLEVEVMCMPFNVFHESISKALGRSVYTHEFGLNRDGLKRELAGNQPPPSMAEIIDMIPKDKQIILVQQ